MKRIFKSKAFQIISYILFLALGIGLLYLAFKNQNWNEIKKAFAEANFYWVLPVLLFNIIGSTLRAWRWNILMQSIGYRAGWIQTYTTLMLGYFISVAVPRLGEISRCLTLQKKQQIPFTASFGTVMAERLIDFFMLFVCIALTFLFTYEQSGQFFTEQIIQPIYTLLSEKVINNPKAWLLIGLVLAGIIYMLQLNKNTIASKQDTLDTYVNELWIGINSIFKLKNYGGFILLTLAIWVSYFMTSYFWLFSFAETSGFGVKEGLAITTIGTLGRSVPIQGGGMGAYHYLVSHGLMVFGVSLTVGNAYAIVNHGAGTLFQIVVGSISGIWLLFVKNNNSQSESLDAGVASNPPSVPSGAV